MSLTWINYVTLIFWLIIFLFFLNLQNILNIVLYSEILWVILYCYVVILGNINDDLLLSSTSFFLLALAGLEFSIGFILIIFFKKFKKSFNLVDKQLNRSKQLNINAF